MNCIGKNVRTTKALSAKDLREHKEMFKCLFFAVCLCTLNTDHRLIQVP